MGWGWGVLTNLLAKILTLGNPSFPCLKCSLYLQIRKRTTSWAPLRTTQHSPLSSNNTHQMLTFAPTSFSGAQKVRQTHGTTLGQWHKPVTCVTSRRTVLWTLFASTRQLRSVIQKSLVVRVQGEASAHPSPTGSAVCWGEWRSILYQAMFEDRVPRSEGLFWIGLSDELPKNIPLGSSRKVCCSGLLRLQS